MEYREFPTRTTLLYLLFSPSVALCLYYIFQVTQGALFLPTIVDHMPLLGIGALAATIALPIIGFTIDRTSKLMHLVIVGSLLAPTTMFILMIMGTPNQYSPFLEYLLVIDAFLGLTLALTSLNVLMSRTIVVRFRGRASASFLAMSIFLALLYPTLESRGIPLTIFQIPIPESMAIITLILACIVFRPWNITQVPLAASGKPILYFMPTVCIMASYMLWYFHVKLLITSDPTIVSLVQEANIGLWEYAFFIGGIAVAGIMADSIGRKTSFSTLILLMAILTIFSSVFLYIDPVSRVLILSAAPLLIFERIIEGYFLGLVLLLIWTEIGSARTKGKRLSLVWFFFLGYMCLFWAVDLNAWGWSIPSIIASVGRESAIFLTLIALYLSGHLPEIVGREMEMEDLQIDFDDREVERTVDAFLGQEDFEAVRHQLEILDVSSDLSDDEIQAILGEEFTEMLPLRRVQGIGVSLEAKLNDAGYTSAAQLAGETPKRLASKVEGLGEVRAKKIIESAREIVKKTLKNNSN